MTTYSQGYDPLAARKLVEKSGYTGELIRIQAARDLYPELFDIAVMAQAMMQEAGLNVEVDPMSSCQLQAFLIGGRKSPELVRFRLSRPGAVNPASVYSLMQLIEDIVQETYLRIRQVGGKTRIESPQSFMSKHRGATPRQSSRSTRPCGRSGWVECRVRED